MKTDQLLTALTLHLLKEVYRNDLASLKEEVMDRFLPSYLTYWSEFESGCPSPLEDLLRLYRDATDLACSASKLALSRRERGVARLSKKEARRDLLADLDSCFGINPDGFEIDTETELCSAI